MATMKLLTIFLAVCVANQYAFASEVTLKPSVDRILAKIEDIIANRPDWTQLPGLIDRVLKCLSTTQVLEVDGNQLPSNIKEYLENLTPAEMAQELASRLRSDGAVQLPKNQSASLPDDLKEELRLFMANESFVPIHNYIWDNAEYLDLIGFFYGAGYPEIYTLIQAFYVDMGQPDLAATIPDAPPAPPSRSHRAKRSTVTEAHNIHGMTSFPIKLKSPIIKACVPQEWLQLLADFTKYNFGRVLELILFVIQEIIGQSGAHVLLIKLGEYQKGEFFDGLLELPQMKMAFPLLHGIILSKVSITELNNILLNLTGFTFENIDLFKYVLDLVQYLVWGLPFPV